MTAPAPVNAPTGLTAQVLGYLAEHPDDWHRPADVRRALFPDGGQEATLKVGTCLAKLARKGKVGREPATYGSAYRHRPTTT